jgi:superfamily II DNA or RNA helicase
MWIEPDQLTEDARPTDVVTVTTDSKSKVLTKRGYSIKKSEWNSKELGELRKSVTVSPYVPTDYGPKPEPFRVYLESNNKIYLPKYFGYQTYGEPSRVKLSMGEACPMKFAGELRENQKPVIKSFLDTCPEITPTSPKSFAESSRGGIISVGCGFGKTVLALYLASKLGRKTLVIVHKEFLVSQWKERIKQYLPEVSVGRIQGKTIDTVGHQIVIGMLQSVSMKDYEPGVFEQFGFCIVDEAHHIAAEVFSRSLIKINSYYMLGLSATPKRVDGLSKVFEWFLGPYVYRQTKRPARKVSVTMVYYDNPCPYYSREEVNYMRKLVVPKMISNITEFTRRVHLVVHILLDLVKNPNRHVLVLSDRRLHLQSIYAHLVKHGFEDVGYYIGGMKEAELKESESKRILLGTYMMSSEGMDIPALNTLVMASPKSNIEQSVGRILRKDHAGVEPVIYDLVDNFSVFRNQAIKRKRFYRVAKYQIYESHIKDLSDTPLEKLWRESELSKIPADVNKKSTTKKTDQPTECLI